MEVSLRRTYTLEKIDRSIHDCLSVEQIDSTEQFLSLYYKQFAFNLQFLKQEWELDNQIIERRKQLDTIEDELFFTSKERKSLKRLEAYIRSLSKNEFEAEWAQIEYYLKEMRLENTSVSTTIHERLTSAKNISNALLQDRKTMQQH